MPINQAKLLLVLSRAQHDVTAAQTAILISIGAEAGFYDALARRAMTAHDLAEQTGTDPRYVESWLLNQTAGGYVTFLEESQTFTLSEEQSAAVAAASPAFDFAVSLSAMRDEIAAAMKSGRGIAANDYSPRTHEAIAGMTRSKASMIIQLLPAALVAELDRGARLLEIGCGAGDTLVALARRHPALRAVGIDVNATFIDRAQQTAKAAAVSERVEFRCQSIHDLKREEFDVALCIETLHELPDPLSALTRMRSSARRLVIIEQDANAQLLSATNLLYCLPTSIAGGGGALGAPVREDIMRDLLRRAGFTKMERVPGTSPFAVFQAEE